MGALAKWIEKKFSQVELTIEDLHKYQHIAFDFAYHNPFSALFMDTGLGKTATLLLLIWRLVIENKVKNVLVIAPLRVATVTWPDELQKWMFSAGLTSTIIRDDQLVEAVNLAGQNARKNAKISGQSKVVIDALVEDARNKAAAKCVREMMQQRKSNVYLINKDQVEFLVDAFGKDWPFDMVIIDESSSLKDHTTKRWKALWRIRQLVKRMHQLTATPTTEGYIHLYAQITLLDNGQRFGKSFNKFSNKFFNKCIYTRRYSLREGAEKQILDLISDICMVMKEEDYLEREKPQTVVHKINLPKKDMNLYQQMEKNFVIELPDGTEIEAETSAALQQKLSQMASGVIYEAVLTTDTEGNVRESRIVHHIHDLKIEKLRQLEEELNGESMLVGYYHQSSLDRILKAFPHAQVMDKKGTLIKKWNAGKIKMLLLHPQSGAHGLNLQHGGRHCVWFDHVWSEELHYQFWRRLARQGQKFQVLIHYLVVKGTIDEVFIECLKAKRDLQEDFFKMLKRIRKQLLKQEDDFEL